MLLQSLRDKFVDYGEGYTVDHIPAVTDKTDAADLLLIAEVLRSTMLAFLTPEEVEERRGIGFHANIVD